ncbi:G-protein coupled bile acid receptor 1 [Trichomycterus rosablanca]|uniref:G-protein coupled bile acid receptor 1 n=1 Tax=Trichomycterus rosablanca TaxID=2290929 RepID=UPI002F35165F
MLCNDSRSSGYEAQLINAITLPISTIIILANLIIILGIGCSRQLHNPSNYIYLSLLVSDLGMGVALPFVPWMSLGRPLSFTLCLVAHVMPNFLFLAFIFNLVLVHYQRYISIVSPLLCTHFWLHRRFAVALLAVWLLPLFFALMPAFGWNNKDEHRVADNSTVESRCAPKPKDNCCTYRTVFPSSFIYIEVYGLLAPSILSIAAMTGRVLWITHGQLRNIQRLQRAVASEESQRKMELRYIRCVAIIALAFLTCWVPYIVYSHMCMAFLINQGVQGNKTVYIVLSCIGMGGMGTVPILLGLANREYTDPARRVMCKLWHRWHSPHHQGNIAVRVLNS